MPSVMQVCSPSALTSRTISVTRSMSLGLGLRHAAPMQKRVAPCFFAACAASTTSASGISLPAATPV
jgi:hypothetical protein